MSKKAIIQLPYAFSNLELKKLVLMFDKIVLIKENYELGMKVLESFAKNMPSIFMRTYKYNIVNVEFLQEKELLDFISIDMFDKLEEDDSDCREMEDQLKYWARTSDKFLFDENLNINEDIDAFGNYNKLMNFLVRLFAMVKSHIMKTDFIPIIDQFHESEKTKRQGVYRFLLQSIPEPKDNVSWEQILDFKNDPDTQKKYYRIVNWINDVSRNNIQINEIVEQYQELLFEYSDRFRIHKMKYNLGTIELITKIISEAISFKFDKAHETFFSIFKQEVNLLEAESGFGGKELAYIHKLKQTF